MQQLLNGLLLWDLAIGKMFLSYPNWHYFLFINASVLNSFLLLNPSYLSISLIIIIRFFSFVHDISHCLWYWVEACVSFSHSISFYNFLWSYLFLRELSQGLQSLHLHQTSSTIHLDGWDKSGCLCCIPVSEVVNTHLIAMGDFEYQS